MTSICAIPDLDVPLEELTLGEALVAPANGRAVEAGPGMVKENEDAAGLMVQRLARSLAEGLAALVREWQETEGKRFLTAMLRRQEDRLAATEERVTDLGGRVEDLTKAAAEQKTVATTTQQTIDALRKEALEMADSAGDRLEALVHRVGLQHEAIADVQLASAELPPRIQALVERLDRQAEALRKVWEARAHAAEVIDRLIPALKSLQAPVGPPAQGDL